MRPLLLAFAALAGLSPVFAQGTSPGLAIELNALQDAQGNCRVTFLATNGLDAALDKASLETAFFDAAGAIDRIVTLDFKALSPGKTKVLQFELAGLDCSKVGRVLINDITACEGEGVETGACLSGLVTTARPDIAFGV